MRTILCKSYGSPDTLSLEDIPSRPLKSHEVRIRVRAAGVNFSDLLMIRGEYQSKPSFPFAPGAECAGDIIEIGNDVTHPLCGSRIIAFTSHGSFADEVIVNADRCLPLPDDISYESGAGFGLTYGTSAYALIQRAALKTDEWLLVHGSSGGVGLAAVEIGKALGAHVIGTGGSDEKLQAVLEHGADHVINYRDEQLKYRVKELCSGTGADVIYDAVGGDIFDQSLRCINWNGRLLVIGFASGRIPYAPANLTLLKNCSIIGVFWGKWTQLDPAENRRNFDLLWQWLRDGKLHPHVSHSFPLRQVPDALNALLNRTIIGKAIITID